MSEEYGKRDRATWQRIFAAIPAAWYEAPPSDAMEQCRAFFEKHPCNRLLDLGCGFGRWALFLSGQGPRRIIGVDYAVNGVREASAWARRAGSDARFLAAAVTSLPFGQGTFDGVLAALLLDNLSRTDCGQTMAEITSTVLPGARGFFVFNPYLAEAELSSVSDDNPTKDCMNVAYRDDELTALLPGWAVTRTTVSAERFRILEGTYSPTDRSEHGRPSTR